MDASDFTVDDINNSPGTSSTYMMPTLVTTSLDHDVSESEVLLTVMMIKAKNPMCHVVLIFGSSLF